MHYAKHYTAHSAFIHFGSGLGLDLCISDPIHQGYFLEH